MGALTDYHKNLAHLAAAMLQEKHRDLKDALSGRGDPRDRGPTRLGAVVAQCMKAVAQIASELGIKLPSAGALPGFAGTENDVLAAYTVMAQQVNLVAGGMGHDRDDAARLITNAWLGLAFFAQHHIKVDPLVLVTAAIGAEVALIGFEMQVRQRLKDMQIRFADVLRKPGIGIFVQLETNTGYPACAVADIADRNGPALQTWGNTIAEALDAMDAQLVLERAAKARAAAGRPSLDQLATTLGIPRQALATPSIYPAVDDPALVDAMRGKL